MVQQQQTAKRSHPKAIEHPRRRDIFFHFIKTFKLISRLLTDRRIPIWRKILFVGSISALLVILLFPDLLGEVFMSITLSLVGTVLGIPIDAGFDWLVFALAAVGLLRFFPGAIVAEHYQDLFT